MISINFSCIDRPNRRLCAALALLGLLAGCVSAPSRSPLLADSGAQSAQVLKDAEVDMISAWNGRIQALQSEPEGKAGKIAVTFDQRGERCFISRRGARDEVVVSLHVASSCRTRTRASARRSPT